MTGCLLVFLGFYSFFFCHLHSTSIIILASTGSPFTQNIHRAPVRACSLCRLANSVLLGLIRSHAPIWSIRSVRSTRSTRPWYDGAAGFWISGHVMSCDMLGGRARTVSTDHPPTSCQCSGFRSRHPCKEIASATSQSCYLARSG
ncbi:hypothetical protein EDB89DRAFT_1336763 [Lactarius sanguifluus]|nr:hypothetical protein EDB89DRAFT_1336763 [Lactarius sanguifluus]